MQRISHQLNFGLISTTQKLNIIKKINTTNDNIEWAKWLWNPVAGCLQEVSL
jgi:hypothetical protein